MNTYAIWVDLIEGSQDLAFAEAVHAFMAHFQSQGLVASYTLERRKFGFGPDGLGEFHVRIQTQSLDQLDQAFHQAATRTGEIEILHAEVFRRVKNFRSGLYRTFPDAVRGKE
jgi:hypothetical protein